MISFATEFPLSHTHRTIDFLHEVRDWILGSPHTVLSREDLEGITAPGKWTTGQANERIEVLSHTSPDRDVAATKYTKNVAGLEWVTTIVFSRSPTDSWVGVRVSCESSLPAAQLPPAKKPVIVRRLLEKLGVGPDASLDVNNTPLRLKNVDIDIAARLLSGSSECRLPVVYVSSNFHDGHAVNVDQLATELAGMAHVIVEPNRAFSLRLKDEVRNSNVYGGTIGVYWPDGAGRSSFFLGREYASATELQRSIVNEVTVALANRRPFDRCRWASVQQVVSHDAIEALKAAGSKEVNRFVEEFDKENEAKAEQLDLAELEIARLQAEVRKYESRVPMGSGPALETGQEQDLYPNEISDIVYAAIKDALSRVTDDSRRAHVLSAIVGSNSATGESQRMREKLKDLLRGEKSMSMKIRRGLDDMGFTISEEGKHYKLLFHNDDRYTFTLPKSGSDYRGGLNAATDIARLFL